MPSPSRLFAGSRRGGVASRHRDGLTLGAIVALTLGSAALGAALPQPGTGAAGAPQHVASGVMRLPQRDVFPVLGEEVHTPAGRALGRVVDLLADGWGQPRAVIVEFGGFLGLGARKVAIDWQALRFSVADGRKRLVAEVAPEQLKQVPEYRPTGRPVTMIGAPETAVGALVPESGP